MPDKPLPYGPIRPEHLPENETDVRAMHEANRASWNEGAISYAQTIDETIAFLRAGKSNLHPVERRNFDRYQSDWPTRWKTAIHLQCASGRDTLSLWNEGIARVIGVDISDLHIENARRISVALNAPAEWYRCDVLDTPHALDNTADLVYTGRGALCWLHDLNAYARVVNRLLKPGGVYHVLDDHPAAFLFDTEAETYLYSGMTYFGQIDSSVGWPTTYIGDTLGIPLENQSRKYERGWNLMEIFNALTGAGLTVEYLGEHPEPYWTLFPNLRQELAGRIPLTFSMLARKKEAS